MSANQAQQARKQAKLLADGLASSTNTISLAFDEQDVVSISATLSHMFDNTAVGLGYSFEQVQMASTSTLNLGVFDAYLNVFCRISIQAQQSEIENCKIGDMPIPGFLVEFLVHSSLIVVFDQEVALTVENLIANARVENRQLVINAYKSIDFKERINDTLNDAKSLAKIAIQTNIPDPEIIQIYLEDIATQTPSNHLFNYVKNSMQLASLRSIDSSPIIENKAAMWAWAIAFGSDRFASLANIEQFPRYREVSLRGRRDLAQHFLFSAIIAQLSSSEFSLNAGELKEILDSGRGGSGFSFADLIADTAGIRFAEVLTLGNESATRAQQQLAQMLTEEAFFPFVHDVPEGLRQSHMTLLFGSTQTVEFNEYVNHINQRIDDSPFYSGKTTNKPFIPPIKKRLPTEGRWLRVDTHIHTKYSDGGHSVAEIATKAKSFGCDAIAITDHGDKNLTGVLSEQFFDDVSLANINNTGLTVMPGLEWNVPPFNGREHATFLLPQNPLMKQQLQQFRSSFDHFEEYSSRHLTIQPAVEWINNIAKSLPVPPIVIYNHPSRKDMQTTENLHDMRVWQQQSSSFIGVSGTPGHQKRRDLYNGSYDFRLKTQHGSDPFIKLGYEWDRLLQQGYRVLAARADSDFHNLSIDYWPCQFSSTHVFSRSNTHNDILQGIINGRTWAQHGKFVDKLNFSLFNNGKAHFAGEKIQINGDINLTVSVDILLSENDWQGFPSKLDELNLVVITERDIYAVDLVPKFKRQGKRILFEEKLTFPSDLKALRLHGRSIQAELHHYPVFTNPIFFGTN